MSYVQTTEYLRCIEPLMAEETLAQLTVSTYPHKKVPDQRKTEKELRTRMRRNLESKRTQATTKDMYSELVRTLGNG